MYLVFGGSLCYYAISVAEIRVQKQKMCKQYDDIIDHYRKVLPEEEIEHITDNGRPLTKAKDSLKRGIIRWSIVWVILIIGAFIIVDYVGDGPHIVKNVINWVRGVLSKLSALISQAKQ